MSPNCYRLVYLTSEFSGFIQERQKRCHVNPARPVKFKNYFTGVDPVKKVNRSLRLNKIKKGSVDADATCQRFFSLLSFDFTVINLAMG